MRPLPAAIWSAIVTVVLAAPPMIWEGTDHALSNATYAFAGAMITAVFAPQLVRLSTE